MNRRKRDLQIATEDVMENSDGVLSLRRDKETEVMQSVPGRIVRNNCRGLGFCSYNRLALDVEENSRGTRTMARDGHNGEGCALLDCGKRDHEWTLETRRRPRLRVQNELLCLCGMKRDEQGYPTLACQRNPWRSGIHNRGTDSHSS